MAESCENSTIGGTQAESFEDSTVGGTMAEGGSTIEGIKAESCDGYSIIRDTMAESCEDSIIKDIKTESCEDSTIRSTMTESCEDSIIKGTMTESCEDSTIKSTIAESCEGSTIEGIKAESCEDSTIGGTMTKSCEYSTIEGIKAESCRDSTIRGTMVESCEGSFSFWDSTIGGTTVPESSSDVTDTNKSCEDSTIASIMAPESSSDVTDTNKSCEDSTMAESSEKLQSSSEITDGYSKIGGFNIPATSTYARMKEERNIAAAIIELDNLIRHMERIQSPSRKQNHLSIFTSKRADKQEHKIADYNDFQGILSLSKKGGDDTVSRSRKERGPKKNRKVCLSLDALQTFLKFNITPPLAMRDVAKALDDLQSLKMEFSYVSDGIPPI
ncbi:hypothetical protein SUGI_0936980 [Cryptomeria japonica]|nr:hypothetical protein SUGI_0936980 [Cryptomeria japonica]